MRRYKQIPHTADLAAKVFGKDYAEIFENAGFCMFDMMADIKGLNQDFSAEIVVQGPDIESLLVNWLNELLYSSFSEILSLASWYTRFMNAPTFSLGSSP